MNDPILDRVLNEAKESGDFEDGDVEYGGAYGVGKWPNAVLTDVIAKDRTDFGYRLGLKFNLKGDEMQYTGQIDLPRTVDEDGTPAQIEARNRANDFIKNMLATIMHRAGILPEGKKFGNVDSQERYDRLVAMFQTAIGKKVPIEVRVRKKKDKDTGKLVETDFTTVQGLKLV